MLGKGREGALFGAEGQHKLFTQRRRNTILSRVKLHKVCRSFLGAYLKQLDLGLTSPKNETYNLSIPWFLSWCLVLYALMTRLMRKIKMPSSERPMKSATSQRQRHGCDLWAHCKIGFLPLRLTDGLRRERRGKSNFRNWLLAAERGREGASEAADIWTWQTAKARTRRVIRFFVRYTIHIGWYDSTAWKSWFWTFKIVNMKSHTKVVKQINVSSSVNLCIFLLTTASLIWSSLLPIPIPLPLLSPTAAVTGRLRGRRMHK